MKDAEGAKEIQLSAPSAYSSSAPFAFSSSLRAIATRSRKNLRRQVWQLDGRIECDEARCGGKRKGKRGWGAAGKALRRLRAVLGSSKLQLFCAGLAHV